MNKQSIKPTLKIAITTLSISALLALSACSVDKTATDETVTNTNNSDVAPVAVTEATEPAVEDTDAATIEMPAQADEVIEPIPEAMETAEAVAAEPEVLLASDAGAKLYESNCKLCHASGLLNAPKYGDKAGWAMALAKDKETLYLHSAQGFNKMPAQAINGVTEAEVKAAVDYMLAAVS